jgi:hypothetical protein
MWIIPVAAVRMDRMRHRRRKKASGACLQKFIENIIRGVKGKFGLLVELSINRLSGAGRGDASQGNRKF